MANLPSAEKRESVAVESRSLKEKWLPGGGHGNLFIDLSRKFCSGVDHGRNEKGLAIAPLGELSGLLMGEG